MHHCIYSTPIFLVHIYLPKRNWCYSLSSALSMKFSSFTRDNSSSKFLLSLLWVSLSACKTTAERNPVWPLSFCLNTTSWELQLFWHCSYLYERYDLQVGQSFSLNWFKLFDKLKFIFKGFNCVEKLSIQDWFLLRTYCREVCYFSVGEVCPFWCSIPSFPVKKVKIWECRNIMIIYH